MNKQIKSCIILLENLLFSSKKYSRKDFMQKLQIEELSASHSSITRVLSKIHVDFGIKIQQKNDFYEIIENETDTDYIDKYKNFKNLIFREIIQKNILENSLITQYISFGNNATNSGVFFIDKALNSILENRKLKVYYQPFYESATKEYVANPLFIKEYQNRWYLISELHESKKIKTFAFDRIKNLEILTSTFKIKNPKNDLFKNTIGINYSDNIEEIVLWFNNWQGNYIKTLPIHATQKIIADDQNGLIISIMVNINFELEQLIKSYGSAAKVIKPESLKLKIIEDFENTLNNYKNIF